MDLILQKGSGTWREIQNENENLKYGPKGFGFLPWIYFLRKILFKNLLIYFLEEFLNSFWTLNL